jgi:hypothetical protein
MVHIYPHAEAKLPDKSNPSFFQDQMKKSKVRIEEEEDDEDSIPATSPSVSAKLASYM